MYNICINIVACSLLETDPRTKEEEEKQQRKIYESFKSGAFEDIVARSEAKVICLST